MPILVAWHKQPGDPVSRDENLADLETDKVVLEVPAPLNGVIKEIRISERHDRDDGPDTGGHRRSWICRRCRACWRCEGGERCQVGSWGRHRHGQGGLTGMQRAN